MSHLPHIFELGVIILVTAYLINSNCKAPHCVIFSTLLSLHVLFEYSFRHPTGASFFDPEDRVSTFLRNISVHLMKNVLHTLGLTAQRQACSLVASVAHARSRKAEIVLMLHLTRNAFTAQRFIMWSSGLWFRAYQSFRGSYCFHLQGRSEPTVSIGSLPLILIHRLQWTFLSPVFCSLLIF